MEKLLPGASVKILLHRDIEKPPRSPKQRLPPPAKASANATTGTEDEDENEHLVRRHLSASFRYQAQLLNHDLQDPGWLQPGQDQFCQGGPQGTQELILVTFRGRARSHN